MFDNTKPDNIDQTLKEEAESEAKNLREIQHDNVLKIVGDPDVFFDQFCGEPFVCIVTEFCEVLRDGYGLWSNLEL